MNLNIPETAVASFKEGFSCSQAILSAYANQFSLDRDTALRLAGGFGGGMGRMAHTCGAVTGAFMVIGLRHSGTRADDREAKEKTYQLVWEFTKRFEARHRSIVCRDLLGCDISIPEGFEQAKREGRIPATCPKLVHDAAEILEEIL